MSDGRLRCCCGNCCCTVLRQVRAYDPISGTYPCTYTTSYVINREVGGTLVPWNGAPFDLCRGEDLKLSGFPANVNCSSQLYPFAYANVMVYCNGSLVAVVEIHDHTLTLNYPALLSACPCAVAGGTCEILIDIGYVPPWAGGVRFAAGRTMTFWTTGGSGFPAQCLVAGNPSEVLYFTSSIPLSNGGTIGTVWPMGQSDLRVPTGAVGKTLAITVPDRYPKMDFLGPNPFEHLSSRWSRQAPAEECIINASTSHTWTVVANCNMTVSAFYTDQESKCPFPSQEC